MFNYHYKKVNSVAALLRRNYSFSIFGVKIFSNNSNRPRRSWCHCSKNEFLYQIWCCSLHAVRFAPAWVTELRNVDELVFSASAWRYGAKRQAALDGLCPGGRYNMCLGVEASVDNGGQSSAEKEHISRRGAHHTIDFCRLDSYHKNDVFLHYNLPFKKGP